MYSVVATKTFERDVRKLDPAVAAFVLQKIEWLAENPEAARFPLRHLPLDLRGLHKFRVGDYRLIFWISREQREIVLYRILHRREVYRELA